MNNLFTMSLFIIIYFIYYDSKKGRHHDIDWHKLDLSSFSCIRLTSTQDFLFLSFFLEVLGSLGSLGRLTDDLGSMPGGRGGRTSSSSEIPCSSMMRRNFCRSVRDWGGFRPSSSLCRRLLWDGVDSESTWKRTPGLHKTTNLEHKSWT